MLRNCIFQTIMETKTWIKYIRNHTPWQRFKEQGKYHLSEQLLVRQMESTITWKKQSWKMHKLSKKAVLGNKRTLLKNKRALTWNKRIFFIYGKRRHWLEDKDTYSLPFHIWSGHFWMFQTIAYRNTWLGNTIIIALTNMLKIRSRGFARARYCNVDQI